VVLFGVVLFFGTQPASCQPVQPSPSSSWITHWMDYGYGTGANDFKLAPRRSPLDHFEEDLLKVHRTLRETEALKLHPVVVPIGKWGPYEVFDVIDEEQFIKEILLRFSNGEYRVLRSLRVDEISGSPTMPRSSLLEIQNRTILVSEVWIYRRVRANDYFVLEPHTQAPVLLDLSAINRGVRQLVPNYDIERLDAYPTFDIRNLSCVVWLETSGPGTRESRGRVAMKFQLQGTGLVMIDGTYNPDAR
jgi:hypothetical protein